MNVLIVAPDFRPKTGGIAEYTHQVAARLHASGDHVLVLSRETKEATDDEDQPYPVRRYASIFSERRPQGLIARSYRRGSGELDLYRMLSGAVADHEPSVLLVNVVSAEARAARLVRRRRGVPYGLFVYGAEITKPVVRRRQLGGRLLTAPRFFALLGADRAICISRFVKDEIEAVGVSPDRTVIARPGVTANNPFRSTAVPEGVEERRVVLTVGRLVERKGFDRVIEAMPRIRQHVPDALLAVVGDGPDRSRLEDLVASVGMESHVRFEGRVSEKEKAMWYELAEVFVMPNRRLSDGDVEGFGIVFLEASANGLPVVGGRSGGAVEAIVDRKTGFLVDPNRDGAVSAAVLRILADPELARQMGDAGRRWASRFSWDDTGLRVRSAIHSLL